jgi:hypothetical protein
MPPPAAPQLTPPDDDADADSGATNPQAPADDADSRDDGEIPTNRFQSPRRAFNAFARSDGTDTRALGRAVSGFVQRAGGGARQSARRMAADRSAAASLGNFLASASAEGIREVARRFNLVNVAGKPIAEVYAALVDVIFQPGGDLDDALARDAYVEAIVDISSLGLADLEFPSADTIALIMSAFMTNAIMNRLVAAIGTGVVVLPTSVATCQGIEAQLKDFIGGAVKEAVDEVGRTFPVDEMRSTVDRLFERGIAILQAYGRAEAEG